MKTYIYILQDPVTEAVRYVGKSINPKKRYYSHISKKLHANNIRYLSKWLNKLLVSGLKPVMTIIDEGDDNEWIDLEKYWISQFKSWGFKLVNGTSGGDGNPGIEISEEQRKRIAISQLSKKGKYSYIDKSTASIIKYALINGEIAIELARKYNTSVYTICRIKKGLLWETALPKGAVVSNRRIGQFTIEGFLIATYATKTEAGKAVDTNRINIFNCLKYPEKEKIVKNYKWKYVYTT